MKTFAKIMAIVFVAVMLVTLVACGNKYEKYEGYQFAGKNPWGEELAITVRYIKNDVMEWTFTDFAGEEMVYAETQGTPLKNNVAEFHLTGTTSGPSALEFDYSGKIELKDGKLFVTYTDGQLTSNSPEGGGAARMVGAVPEAERTVTLERVILDK